MWKECPACGLANTGGAERCDCGHAFEPHTESEAEGAGDVPPPPKPGRGLSLWLWFGIGITWIQVFSAVGQSIARHECGDTWLFVVAALFAIASHVAFALVKNWHQAGLRLFNVVAVCGGIAGAATMAIGEPTAGSIGVLGAAIGAWLMRRLTKPVLAKFSDAASRGRTGVKRALLWRLVPALAAGIALGAASQDVRCRGEANQVVPSLAELDALNERMNAPDYGAISEKHQGAAAAGGAPAMTLDELLALNAKLIAEDDRRAADADLMANGFVPVSEQQLAAEKAAKATPDRMVTVIAPDGEVGEIPAGNLQSALEAGFRLPAPPATEDSDTSKPVVPLRFRAVDNSRSSYPLESLFSLEVFNQAGAGVDAIGIEVWGYDEFGEPVCRPDCKVSLSSGALQRPIRPRQKAWVPMQGRQGPADLSYAARAQRVVVVVTRLHFEGGSVWSGRATVSDADVKVRPATKRIPGAPAFNERAD